MPWSPAEPVWLTKKRKVVGSVRTFDKPESLEEHLQRDLTGVQLRRFLRDSGLPKDYPGLNSASQLTARKASFTSWFDLAVPQVLCNNVRKFIKAFYLWCEYYQKQAEHNRGVYYYDDPTFKYDMVDTVMHPNQEDEDEPGKTIITATRRTGKTQTLIIEMMPFMCINRPFTSCMITEFNEKRSKEELKKIMLDIQMNEFIIRDFGGKGVLYPAKSLPTHPWSSEHIKFLHHPGSDIKAFSSKQAQRGRGVIYLAVDDPETEEVTYSREWRRQFFDKIFNVFAKMVMPGGIMVWIGTPIHKGSALYQATKRSSDKLDVETATKDPRFYDWRVGKFPNITMNDKGKWVSHQPQRMSVRSFEKKLQANPLSASAEILCEPITPGRRVFGYERASHGYLRARDGNGEYSFDLKTGERKSWDVFLSELRIFAAGDLADGESEDSDPGALILVGIDPYGITYVLDAVIGRIPAERLIELAYILCVSWGAEAIGWEEVSMQVTINRMGRKFLEELRDQGKMVPVPVGVENTRKNKTLRILTMIPLFQNREIRFLEFDSMRDLSGVVHKPIPNDHQEDHEELRHQILEYTDQGIRGPDDGVDALEMAIRISDGARGESLPAKPEKNTDLMLAKWEEEGIPFSMNGIPRQCWTEETEKRLNVPHVEDSLIRGVVPYV